MTSLLCPVCAQASFSSIEALRTSLVKVANGPLPCPLCGDHFCGLDKLTIHLFSHSIPPSNGSTTVSAKRFLEYDDPWTAANAVTVEDNIRLACDICEATFQSEYLRDIHTKVMHQCSRRKPLVGGGGHGGPPLPPAKDIPSPLANRPVATESNYTYKCHLCAKMFKLKGSLRVHLKVVHSPSGIKTSSTILAIGGDGQKPDEGTLSRHESGESPKCWECDVCSKSFTTKYFLKKHKRLHTGEMPYTCELCGRTFTFQQSYHKHLLYHSDEKPHNCGVCGRAFKELSTLHNHERIHSGEKPFKCEICGKSFRQRVSFLVHTRIHTGVMPYQCEICQKRFRYKVSQRTHKCSGGVEGLHHQLQMEVLDPCPHPPPPTTTDYEGPEHLIQTLLESSAPVVEEASTLTEQESLSLLTRSIDEFVLESCHKLGITGNDHHQSDHNLNC